MKKAFYITAILLLISFSFVISSEAFFCEDGKQKSASSQSPAHCCVQCCPTHNLVPTSNHAIVLIGAQNSERFVMNVSIFQEELFIASIDRPPIA